MPDRFDESYKPVAVYFTDSDILEYVTKDTACVYDQIDTDFAVIRQMGTGDVIGFRLERFSKLRR